MEMEKKKTKKRWKTNKLKCNLCMQQFWAEIFRILSTLMNKSISPDPVFALLNRYPPDLTKAQSRLAI